MTFESNGFSFYPIISFLTHYPALADPLRSYPSLLRGCVRVTRLEVYAQNPLNRQSLAKGLETLVTRTFIIVVLHIFKARKFRLSDQGVTLCTRIWLRFTNSH